MEVRAQEHSSAETNDESKSGKRKRFPKKLPHSEESNIVKKRRKTKAKSVPKKTKAASSSECSDESLSEPETPKYEFKRSRTIRFREWSSSYVVPATALEDSNSKSVSVLDVVTIVPAKDAHTPLYGSSVIENQHGFADLTSSNFDEASPTVSPLAKNDIDPIEPVHKNICSDQENDSALATTHQIGDVIEIPFAIGAFSGGSRDAQQSTLLASLFNEIAKLNSKVDLVLSNQTDIKNAQDGFKNVVVDLAYKILRLEEQLMNSKNTSQQLKLSLELSIPIVCPESFKLNEAALLAKNSNRDSLVCICILPIPFIEKKYSHSSVQVSHVCNVNVHSELDSFIKESFRIVFDLDFFYKSVIWKTEPDRFNIKDTELMKCIVRKLLILFDFVRSMF